MHVMINIMIVSTVEFKFILKSSWIMLVISGVAKLNVVAVPANKAMSATQSMSLPKMPSVCFPKIGRHASEYF